MGNHGTKQTEDSDIDRSAEYVAFMKDLASYHQQRGTHLQREPALGPRRISLLKLYNKIIGYGGYDKVSDTSLMWRRIADEYHVPPMSNAGMPGYLLKSMYYKNLAAFEIERHWGKKAPPPELLEHLTARGGAILSRPEIVSPMPPRTVPVSYPQPKNARTTTLPKLTQQQHQQQHQPQQQQQHQQQHIPAQIMIPHMPPVTQMTDYNRSQPESEYVRALYPITAGQFGSSTLHDTSTNHLLALISRSFIDQHKPEERQEERVTLSSLFRATMSLKSGLESETGWAIKTLVRASYELADDLMLEKISGLAEVLLAIIETAISDLCQKQIKSDKSDETGDDDDTRELANPSKRTRLCSGRFGNFGEFSYATALGAALILRNMTFQSENARFIARLPITTKILRAGLLLENEGVAMELKEYCVELCDAVVPALQISSEEDPFYLTLAGLLRSDDRIQLLLGLRALSRLSVADEHNRLLQDISSVVISRLISFLQLEDVELLHALVAFFFQFTTYQSNTSLLMRNGDLSTFLRRLTGLTMWNAQERVEQVQITLPQMITRDIPPPPANPPQLSDEIVRELLTFQEPERAIHWMRACFEDDKEQSVTQILLWQSYRTLFTPFSQPQQNGTVVVSGKPLLQAADVIKMVGNAFHGATAMVVNHPTEGQKFIVRGIRCREYPLAPSGKRYATCRWVVDREAKTPCAAPFATQKELHAHIMAKHVKTVEGPISCCWAECSKFSADGETDHKKFSIHLRLHTSEMFPVRSMSRTIEGSKISIANQHTLQDDKGEPTGLALSAALTLRNILCAEARVREIHDMAPDQLRHDILHYLTINPVVAHQSGEVLAAL